MPKKKKIVQKNTSKNLGMKLPEPKFLDIEVSNSLTDSVKESKVFNADDLIAKALDKSAKTPKAATKNKVASSPKQEKKSVEKGFIKNKKESDTEIEVSKTEKNVVENTPKSATKNKVVNTEKKVLNNKELNVQDLDLDVFASQIAELGFDPFIITDRLIDFGVILTGINLYEYQRESAWRIIYSVLTKEGATLTMLFSRQSGKSEAIAFVCATLSVMMPTLARIMPILEEFKEGFFIGLFAPQYEQVTTTYQRTLKKLGSDEAKEVMADSDIKTGLVSAHRVTLSNGSYMTGQVACKISKIECKTYHLCIIEEAQDTDDLIVAKSIEPMMTATLGTLVKVGTTGVKKGDFFHEIQRNSRRSIKKFAGKLRFHFQYNYLEIIRQKRLQYEKDGKLFHLNYEKFIAQQIEKRGTNNEAFKLAYALIWALDAGMFLTDSEWNSVINKHKIFIRTVDKKWDIRAGLDIAKDRASTVLTVGKRYIDEKGKLKKEVINIIDLGGIGYEEQYNIISQAIDDYNITVLMADYTGVGRPVVDRFLAHQGNYCEIKPYTFTRQSKSDMWVNLRMAIENRNIEIPAHSTIRDTSEYRKLEEQMKGMNKYFEGSFMVAHKGSECPFDDYCDSLGLFSLACEVELSQRTDIIENDINPFYSNSEIVKNIYESGWN